MKKIIRNNFEMIRYIFITCPKLVFSMVLKSILNNTIPVFQILLTRKIIELLELSASFSPILSVIIIVFALNVMNGIISIWLEQKIIPVYNQELNGRMRLEMVKKASEMDIESYDDEDYYNKLSYSFTQSEIRTYAILQTFSMILGQIFGVLSLVTIIFIFEPVIIILIFVSVLIIQLFNIKTVNTRHELYKEKIPAERIFDYVKRVYYLKDYAKEIRLYRNVNVLMKDYLKDSVSRIINLLKKYGNKLFLLTSFQNVYLVGMNTIIMIYLVYKITNKEMLISDFVTLTGSASTLFSFLNQLLSSFSQLHEHSIYIDNFKDFMNTSSRLITINNSGNLLAKDYKIFMDDISFNYPKSNEHILNNINLSVKSGQKIAIVGPNGAGKTTLIKLIARLYDPSKGKMFLDSLEYNEYQVEEIRDRIGVITQDYKLFALSVAENVLVRKVQTEKDSELVIEALKFVGLYDKISSLPNGIHSIITREFHNDGIQLSGGEMQKLAIARLYAKDCDILILDEPTSNLDPIIEEEIFETLFNLMEEKTVIVISHRLSSIKNVDKIVYLENGAIQEEGSHEELMLLNQKYAKFFNAQAKKYKN